MSATFALELAWASIDAEACTKMLYFAKAVLSVAMSTSTILPLAASRFVRCCAAASCARTEGGIRILHSLLSGLQGFAVLD